MDDRYLQHAKATAICVELALGGIQSEVQAELDKSSGTTSEALQRLLEQIALRQKSLADLLDKEASVQQMIDRLNRAA